MSGVPLAVVGELLGHKQARSTELALVTSEDTAVGVPSGHATATR